MDSIQFQTLLEERGISLSSQALEQFEAYFKLLTEWNEKVNLTSITDRTEVYIKHFYDSISAAFFMILTDLFPFAMLERVLVFPAFR